MTAIDSVASDGSDYLGFAVHFSDDMVFRVGNIDVLRTIDKNPLRFIERSGGSWSIISCISMAAVASDGSNYLGFAVHFSDEMIFRVGNIDIVQWVNKNRARFVELGQSS